MDLNTIAEVARPASRQELPRWQVGDGWLAGGTWLFSTPQPELRRLVDLEGLAWEPLEVTDHGLEIAATCTIARLDALRSPPGWKAAPLIRECCRALVASFKIWNTATVGGNICMSLPAGSMISLASALEGVCTIWLHDGGVRQAGIDDFVTGAHENILQPGDLLRSVQLPARALCQRSAFRRMSMTHQGRSTALLIGTLCPEGGQFGLSVTAATLRPVRLEFPSLPDAAALRAGIHDQIPDALYLDDAHGTPEYRRHLTCYFAEEIRRELLS
jgi:CO/xanthine dehydrogenase FAD-binding subunit